MRLVYAGTPDFAVATLEAIHASRHEIVAVYTQPDRPSGRGQKLRPSAVKQAALARNLRLIQVENFKSKAAIEQLRALDADAMVVVAYGLLLAQAVLDLFPAGCWNLHASCLPRWRGAAPIARAIEAGDRETGVAVMKMEKGLDTGPVLSEFVLSIGPHDSAQSLQHRLAMHGAGLMVGALDRLERLRFEPLALAQALKTQSADGATYASKLHKSEGLLDFSQPAALLERRMRAFDPVPGCFCWFFPQGAGEQALVDNPLARSKAGQMIKCWRGRVHPGVSPGPGPRFGLVVGLGADGPIIACGEDFLELIEVQQPGGLRVAAMPWAQQTGVKIGDFFAKHETHGDQELG